MPGHTCHSHLCTAYVAPEKFMCVSHWRSLPPPWQKAIWNAYRPGQEVDKMPSGEYLATARAAINAVAIITGQVDAAAEHREPGGPPYPRAGRCLSCAGQVGRDPVSGLARPHRRVLRRREQDCTGAGRQLA